MGVFIQSLDSVDDLVDEDVGGVLQVGEVLRKLRDLKVLDLNCNLSYFCNANGKKGILRVGRWLRKVMNSKMILLMQHLVGLVMN